MPSIPLVKLLDTMAGHSHSAHDHDHDHDHDHNGHGHHGHSHGHHHADPSTQGRALGVSIVLNTAFVVVEAVYGYLAHSTALLADAGHNLSDILGLALAWAAVVWARRAPDRKFTYGLRSSSTLVALANAAFLLIACGAIGWEAVQRFWAAPDVNTSTVMWVASIGILINGGSALMLMRGSSHDLNMRGAYLHMVGDAAISLGVVVAALFIRFTGWNWLDSVTSLVIVVVIVKSSWGLLRESLDLALNAVPAQIDAAAIGQYLRSVPGVTEVHDLHIWGISTTENALTAHLVVPAGNLGDTTLDAITAHLRTHFSVHHSTLQCEQGTTAHHCALQPAVH